MQKVKNSDVLIEIEEEASKLAVLHRKALWDWMATPSERQQSSHELEWPHLSKPLWLDVGCVARAWAS